MNTMTDMQRAGLHPDQAESRALEALGTMLQDSAYRFTTVTPATHARVNARPGNEWAKDLAGIFGWSRPFHASVVSGAMLDCMRAADILEPYQDGFRCRLRASSLHGKLFFHSAYPTTENDAVFFGPDTYRFATAIEDFYASRSLPVRRAVDIGCGAGPGAILVAERFPGAEVFAADINPSALKLAAVNAALAGTENVAACISDLLQGVSGNFDLILSNPPYLLDPSQRAYRHGGGSLGAGLSLAIIRASLERLNPGGTLLLYSGAAIVDGIDPLRREAEDILRDQAVLWAYHEMDPDIFGEELSNEAYAQADRIAAVVLKVTKPVQADKG